MSELERCVANHCLNDTDVLPEALDSLRGDYFILFSIRSLFGDIFYNLFALHSLCCLKTLTVCYPAQRKTFYTYYVSNESQFTRPEYQI